MSQLTAPDLPTFDDTPDATNDDAMKDDVWFEATWDNSLPSRIRGGLVVSELFSGASATFKNVNPETFQLPLHAIVVCMKLDTVNDMIFCVRNGQMANNDACSNRMNEIWASREGNRVYLMFSVKTTKQFCALAEMTDEVNIRGDVEGWSKPNCNGLLPVTFLYIKNVAFTVINHMASKENGQPVTNMWNSMMYGREQGREVVMRYVKHPCVSSILLFPVGEEPLPPPHGSNPRLRIPSSGHSVYSASSLGSGHSKYHDPRSAVVRYGAAPRGPRSDTNRRALDGPWRAGATSSFRPSAPQPQKSFTRPANGVNHNRFALYSSDNTSDDTDGTDESSLERPKTFTTPDEQTIAGFQAGKHMQSEKPLLERQTSTGIPYTRGGSGATRGGFRGGRGGRMQFTGAPINTDWRNAHDNSSGVAPEFNARPQVQSATLSRSAPFLPGLGISSAPRLSTHLPTRSMSSQSSDEDPFRDPFVRFQQRTQATPTSSDPTASPYTQSPASQYDHHVNGSPGIISLNMDGAHSDEIADSALGMVSSEYPAKCRQSMPDIRKPSATLSAKAPDFVPQTVKKEMFAAAPLGVTKQQEPPTPTHKTTLALAPYSPASSFRTDGSLSPDKIEALKPAEKARYYMCMMKKMQMRADEAKLDMEIARIEHSVDRGELAKSTTESEPSRSPPDSSYSDDPYFISPTQSEQEQYTAQIIAAENLNRATLQNSPNPAHNDRLLGHRRSFGGPGNNGFSGSFDARITADTLNIIGSPTHANGRRSAGNTPTKFAQQGAVRFTASPPRMIMRPETDADSVFSFEGGVHVNDEHFGRSFA